MKALVTGHAGFVGFHLCRRLLQDGWHVVGLDSFNDYYDVSLKEARAALLIAEAPAAHVGMKDDIQTPGLLAELMAKHRPDLVVHLAAQAGVRSSIDTPRPYAEANLMGTYELLEAIRANPPRHTLIASTSSVYGANTALPYSEDDKTDHQMSFYAATKKASEAMAHSYAHLYNLPITMFRFFTVYGPWGRPDMALFKFTKAILEGRPIDVYNHGRMRRDFTYINDLVEALFRLIDHTPTPGTDTTSPVAPFRILNIGNSQPVKLTDFIAAIEMATGRTAQKNLMDIQPGDVPATWADTGRMTALTGFQPDTSVAEGVAAFVAWYREYYGL